MAAPGNFTTLAASGAVTLPLGAQVGYLWQCSNAGTGACGWVAPSAVSPSGALTVSSADTNLSVTLGGTPSTALLAAASIGVNWSGLLAVTRGGTGFGSCVLGDLPYGSGSNTMAMLAANATATRKFLLSVSGGAPQWTTLTAADIASATMNFTSIGFAMTPPSNAYISTTNRAGIAGANYQISLGGTYTGISSTTSIIDLDITTTHTSTTSTLTTSAGIQITPNTNATSATITSSYGMLINTGTNSGGTVTNAYSIYNNIQTIAATNYGYYQTGTFTKTGDVGLQLLNTFSPTAAVGGQLSQLSISSTYTPTSGPYTVAAFYNCYSNPTIAITSASVITTTAYYGLSVKPVSITFSGAAHTITTYYGIYSATPSATLGTGSVGTAYSGYFANPSFGTAKIALYADSLQVATSQCSTTTTGQNTYLYLPTMAGPPTTATAANPANNVAAVYDSTNGGLYIYPGASLGWQGCGWTRIAVYTCSGSPTNPVNMFPTIPQCFNHLRIVYNCRTSLASVEDDIRISFNGDTGGNYAVGWFYNQNGSTQGIQTSGYIYCGACAGASASAGFRGSGTIEINNYKDSTSPRQVFATGQFAWSTTAGSIRQYLYGGYWNAGGGSTIITSIQLWAGGQFQNGDTFYLYGLN